MRFFDFFGFFDLFLFFFDEVVLSAPSDSEPESEEDSSSLPDNDEVSLLPVVAVKIAAEVDDFAALLGISNTVSS